MSASREPGLWILSKKNYKFPEGHWEDPKQVEFLERVEKMSTSSVVHDTEGTWAPDKNQIKKC